MAKKGCKICHCLTQELDTTGRCGSCAAVLRTVETGESYGNLIAREQDEEQREQRQKQVLIAEIKPKRKPAEPTIKKVCPHCGAEFMAISPKKKYCSNTCKKKVWRTTYDRKRKEMAENGQI